MKYCIFEFINNFIALFYIAFVYRDFTMLRLSVRNFFIINMVISQIMESVVPFVLAKKKKKANNHRHILDEDREDYLSTFDDYLELWLQFGHICLFSSIFPQAAIFALINNLIEVRTDAYRLINTCRRNIMDPTSSIGARQLAFQGLGYIAIISNISLKFKVVKSYSQIKKFKHSKEDKNVRC